ncbi:MAG: PEGA domain-containing protein [Proteobacteria bacterium]|nr:PEGA domain-containing protein [Pseudomonadota bacterium]
MGSGIGLYRHRDYQKWGNNRNNDQIDDVHSTISANVGVLKLTTTPQGATVYLDNRKKGETPLTLGNVITGSRSLRFERDGYKSESKEIQVNKDEVSSLTVTLTRGK